jgi:pimeloyl-ACP methyl ester carboxylesterase
MAVERTVYRDDAKNAKLRDNQLDIPSRNFASFASSRLIFLVGLMLAGTPWISAAPASEIPAQMYQQELAGQYDPATLSKLATVHQLIEKFFDPSATSQRKQIIAQIDASGLPPSIVGRIARLRQSWSALAPGVYYINKKVGPIDVRYFLGIPRLYDVSHPWPLVVKLPAANAFLTQPPPDAQAVTQIYTQWMTDELTAHPDAIVVMPLLNLRELYGPGPIGMNLVMQPILDAADEANVDPARVYLIGHSMAAHAVWNLAIHYPTYFAATNPMAGSAHDSWQRIRLGNLENILCIVWHDASDDVVNVDESRSIVAYLRNLKYDVDYTETRDLGHVPSPQIVQDEYKKLRSRTRDLYPPRVFIQSNNSDTPYNRADWVQIYQPMSPGEQAKVQFSRGSGGMYLYQNSFRVIAEISDPHTIKLATRNVRLVRLYLNDQLVDLDHPLKVIVNGVAHYDAVVPQSTQEMLKDQLFLGRGWRYYTAVIDLDLSESPATVPTTRPHPHAPIEYTTPEGEHKIFVPKDN